MTPLLAICAAVLCFALYKLAKRAALALWRDFWARKASRLD